LFHTLLEESIDEGWHGLPHYLSRMHLSPLEIEYCGIEPANLISVSEEVTKGWRVLNAE
jgi:hypothetical protein